MACTCGHPGLGCECYYQSSYGYLIPDPPKKKKKMRVERKTTITLNGISVKVGELTQVLAEFPAEATLRVKYVAGDPRDQRESSYATFEIELPKP